MISRIAACMSLIAFAVCLLVGIDAGNPFGTVVSRALAAMLGTFIVGLVVGWMAQNVLDENLRAENEKLEGPKNIEAKPIDAGR